LRGTCNVCRRVKNEVRKSRKTGEMTCTECGKPVEICFFCNNLRKVHTRTEEGKAVCSSCHGKMRLKNKDVHEVCSLCGNKKPVKIRGPKVRFAKFLRKGHF
jgi:predicted RNA-binding Zn-ribbon protein involved in translation (DUF1610 family)